MPHTKALTEARKAGMTLARTGESRAYVNDVARTLRVDEADALLAGYYAEMRRAKRNAHEDFSCGNWFDL